MSRRRTNRKSKTIGIKAFEDTDADILAWWASLPDGDRSHILRDIIRAAIQPRQAGDAQPLDQVCKDTAWIRNTLADLPRYLDRLVQQIAVLRPVAHEDGSDEIPQVEQTAVTRRRDNMRQNEW